MIYTGVGSRAVPMEFLLPIKEIAFWAAKNNWTLRSGGADGCDSAFETFHHGEKEIFLPWKGFNKNRSELFPPPADAYVIAETIHPNWWGCSKFSKDFHARNIQQVLGRDLDSPTDCVVCWTPEGATVGGTATAIRCAMRLDIPVFNLALLSSREIIMRMKDLQDAKPV